MPTKRKKPAHNITKPLSSKADVIKRKFNINIVIALLLGILIGLIAFDVAGCVAKNAENQHRPNQVEDSRIFAGYSPYKLYQVFDRQNGVYYIVSETGDIELMVNPDGSPKMVDGGPG